MDKINQTSRYRDSNLELYRIVTMLLIIAHHFVVNSGILNKVFENPLSSNSIFLLLFGAWGKTGINCFVMITGYFMCKSNITLFKYVKLVSEVLFYTVIISMIFALTGYTKFMEVFCSFLIVREINSGHFTACFLIFYLLIPFLNVLLNNLNRLQHRRIIEILSFLYIFLGTMPKFNVTMNYISWFCTLYIVAAYIRFYPSRERKWGLWTIFFIGMAILSILVCLKFGFSVNDKGVYSFVNDSNTFFAFAIAICSFMYFKGLNIKYSKIINAIGGSTFGVLLIHANSYTMISWLWIDFLKVPDKYTLPFFDLLLYSIFTVLGIFVVCTLVDWIRIQTVEKLFLNSIENNMYWKKIKNAFEIF